jgi:Outer membrane protein beta-barrel domain
MKRILALAFFTALCGTALAQNCAQTLRLARSTYDQGRLHELPGLMKPCLANNGADGFTKQERVEAYKLLTLAYIYLEEPEKADSTMLKLLNTDHYFEINKEVDPAEFIGLYKTFRTDPVYRIGIKAGAMASQPNVANSNSANDGTSSYDNKIGILVGAFIEIPVLKKFVLNPEIYFQSKTFGYNNTHSIANTPATETQNWISVPVSLQYEFFKQKFKDKKLRILPYVSVGAQADYQLSGTISLTTTKTDQLPVAQKSYTLNRNSFNISAIISAGVKIKAGPGLIVGEVRYMHGLKNLLNPEDVYANQFTVFDNYVVDGIFKLNSLSVTIGYAYNVFNPKKLKR